MTKLKKMFFSLLLASNSVVFSGTMGESASWEFGALALFLQPSYGGNDLGYSSFSNYGYDNLNNLVEANGAADYVNHVLPDFGWGFQLEAVRHINQRHDFNLNWYHLNTKKQGTLPTGTLFAGSASGLYAGLIQLEPTWDAVNLESGQSIAFTLKSHLRYHVGVSYSHIKNMIKNYPRLMPTSAPLFVTTDTTTYNGFGPRIGVALSQNIVNNFSIYATAATSLLVGTAQQSVSGYQNFPAFVPGDTLNPYSDNNYLQKSHSVVIPELEAKLGATYQHDLAHGTVLFDIGYMWIDYFNVIVSRIGAGVVSSSISASNAANFNLNGLYFGAQWTGNVI